MSLTEFHDALERSGGMIGRDLRAIGLQSRWHRSLLAGFGACYGWVG